MATVPTYRTWVVGELVTASFMNTNVRDSGNFLTAFPLFEGRQTVAQAIANVTNTPVNLDTEDIDSDNGHSTVTNTSRYTLATAGWWRISGGVGMTANGTGARQISILKNGGVNPGSAQWLAPGAVTFSGAARSKCISGIVGDFFEIAIFQNSTIALNTVVVSSDGQSNMSAQWVRV
jgi:hypothetical protein